MKDRFWSKVDKTGDCWVWTASINQRGYGQFKIYDRGNGKQKVMETHRIAWLLENSDIPVGMQICHKCDNPLCVRLEHLFLGTPKDNAQDMARKGRATMRSAKLDEATVVAIRYDYANGISGDKIAKQRRIPKSTVLGILNGKRWKRVGGPIRDPGIRYWSNRHGTGKTGC